MAKGEKEANRKDTFASSASSVFHILVREFTKPMFKPKEDMRSTRSSHSKSVPGEKKGKLHELLCDKIKRAYFQKFLQAEHADENLSFWADVEEFRDEIPDDKVLERARYIYQTYVALNSPREVNISDEIKQELIKRLSNSVTKEKVNRHIFNLAQDCVLELLGENFRRFQISPLFEECLKEAAKKPKSRFALTESNTDFAVSRNPRIKALTPSKKISTSMVDLKHL